MPDRPWSSTAPPEEFRTYISAEESPKEFTIRAVVLGALFGLPPLPASFVACVVAIVAAYVLTVELVKRVFYRHVTS